MPTKYNRKCSFCEEEVKYIDYKNLKTLRRYISRFGKIVPKYYSCNCLKHQKSLAKAVKNARIMGLLPFVK